MDLLAVDARGVHNWNEMSVDEKREIVFIPFGTARYDFYGADRHGQNLFGNSIVALAHREAEVALSDGPSRPLGLRHAHRAQAAGRREYVVIPVGGGGRLLRAHRARKSCRRAPEDIWHSRCRRSRPLQLFQREQVPGGPDLGDVCTDGESNPGPVGRDVDRR